MSRLRRAWIAVPLTGGFAAAVVWLPLVAALVLGGFLALTGVVLFEKPRWRTGSLLLASLLLGFAGAEATFGVLAPSPVNRDVVKVSTPSDWTITDKIVGYRPKPGTTIDVVATYNDEVVYRQTYTIDASGARVTPGSLGSGPTYLLIGDSFMFGEGLADNETVAAQFARRLKIGGHVVNLGVLGYAPNHLVRAVETGHYDSYVIGKVAAVVTWITPYQLPRVTGDGGWLGGSPRYVLNEHGGLQHTGTFNAHRMGDPLAGVAYLARTYLAAAARAAHSGLERERAALYVALIARLRELVRERYGAPLIVVYHWPDGGAVDLPYLPTLNAIRALGMPMVSVKKMIGPPEGWYKYFIAHDGHPNAHLASLVAQGLVNVLDH